MSQSGPVGGVSRSLRGATRSLRGRAGRYRLAAALAVLLAVALIVVSAGRDGDGVPAGTVRAAQTLGPTEGALSLVTWPGLVENGGSDERVNWVAPFEERTSCRVSIKQVSTAQELVDLMSNSDRRYDGALAPPEAAGRLIDTGHVAPVNPDLVDGYKRLEPRLRALLKRADTVYGVPYVWGSNLLMYDQRAVQPAPTGWADLFDPDRAQRYGGRLVMRDTPLALAEAALYLRSKRKSLDITDPYALTREQLDAAAKVVREQRPYVKSYWTQPADAVSAFAGGEAAMGQVSSYQLDVLSRAGRPVAGVVPREGVTGWANSWLVGARAEHPNCMYEWLKWTSSPDVQRQVAEWAGVAPANPQACEGDRLKSSFCATYQVGDDAYLKKVIFARTPTRDCDGERRDECTDYAEWTRAWQEARGLTR
ncbi:putative spermidine/putrescine transport system substrate-binding protein [Thermomonospora echinospora]|uniref:Putative spermidine/putrescine transport system substrate-binding protein n=1 Tax=Thermomonospora echinospora TaxID=1992 RepID=A0A1H6BQT0_9ACTN|nr:ABC transporter substrate-binding protein [Thermomonospora echinospora]SEG62566.1 putative spermidine/putrescine transport system substrate-binding protein [Thermomonospora echinospora]